MHPPRLKTPRRDPTRSTRCEDRRKRRPLFARRETYSMMFTRIGQHGSRPVGSMAQQHAGYSLLMTTSPEGPAIRCSSETNWSHELDVQRFYMHACSKLQVKSRSIRRQKKSWERSRGGNRSEFASRLVTSGPLDCRFEFSLGRRLPCTGRGGVRILRHLLNTVRGLGDWDRPCHKIRTERSVGPGDRDLAGRTQGVWE